MVCQRLETIWLVIRFFSLVKNIVWPITDRIWNFSLVKKSYRVFPPFGAACTLNVHNFRFPWIMASRFADTIYRRPSKRKHKKENSTECCFAEGISEAESRIPPKELNTYISEFIITVRKKDNNEDYEPSFLCSLMASFERYLKKKNYGFSIMKDAEFEQARKALQSKQKDLKQKGKGWWLVCLLLSFDRDSKL